MKDCLYKKGEVSEDFSFNEQVAAVFDDMLNRSIPCYALAIDAMAHILERRLPAGAQAGVRPGMFRRHHGFFFGQTFGSQAFLLHGNRLGISHAGKS